MQEWRDHGEPLVIERAQGPHLFEADGSRYLDANASWWSSSLGHGHPRLLAALRRQSESLCHAALGGITHAPAAELAEALCRVAPAGLEHVFFSDDGSTAVEVAMKLSLQFWAQQGRPERSAFVALEGAFHGETLGATALGGVEVFRRPFEGALLECHHVPPPLEPGSLDRCVAALEGTLALALDPARARGEIPVLRMIDEPLHAVRARADRLAELVGGEVEETVAKVGGGSLPLAELASFACAIEEALFDPLRAGEPPVVGIVRDGRLLLDVRALADGELAEVAAAVQAARTGAT